MGQNCGTVRLRMKKLIIILLICSMTFAQQKAWKHINSFNAGELSPLVKAREDLSKFHSGLATMENMIPLPQGAAQKRPGTKYVAGSKSNTKIRLLPFEYSTDESYIIELGNQYARFFTDNDVIYKPYGTEDLSTHSTNIIAHWKCDDNAANTTVDNDEGTAALDGTATSNTEDMTTTDESGTANEAFDLDNTDYITISDHDDLSFGDGSDDSPVTFLAWVQYTNNSASQYIFCKSAAGNTEYWIQVQSDDKIEVNFSDDSASKVIRAETDYTLSSGWHFIAVTYNGKFQSGAIVGEPSSEIGINIYVDWVPVKASVNMNQAGYVSMENKAADLIIGATNAGGSVWEEKIDNVAILDIELTQSQIVALQGSDSTTQYEVTTPYLTADLFDLKYKQSADILYITHPDYEPKTLSRYGNAAWLLESISITTGPFLDENTDIVKTITPSSTTGSITLQATGFSPFISGTTAGHLPSGSTATSKSQTGALFKIIQPLATASYMTTLTDNYTNDQTENTSWLDCGTVAEGVTFYLTTLGTWIGTLEIHRNYTIGAAHDDSGWELYPGASFKGTDDRNITFEGTESIAEADYRCILTTSGDAAESCKCYFRISDIDHVGIVEITAVTDGDTATATVIKTLANTSATHRWSEGSWSNYRGWPRAVTFYEDRLIFGGNANQPDTIWGSETASYDNFIQDTEDDDPFSFTLSSRQVNIIEWLIGKDKLLIGTSGAEWTLSGGADEPLTPSNVKAEQHSNYGSANLQAILANESVIFFQRGAEKMRELAYNWELDSYVAPDMTILAEHITGDGITEFDYQKTPNSILYCVRDDGELAIFVYERKELITSWSRFITDGLFESVAVISGDPEDEVWVSVNRTIEGSTKRYVEYFADRDFGTDVDDAYFVDCGDTYDSTARLNIGIGQGNTSQLEGETVLILADGVVFDSQTISSGTFWLKLSGTSTSASTVQWGLPYDVEMLTLPMSLAAQGASIMGRMNRINMVIPNYYNSGDFYIGRDATDKELLSISGMDSSDVDTDDRVTFPAGNDRFGQIYIYQQSPEPLTLLSLLVEVGFY